jgi:transcriptional regulator with XRE-family HTH domain
MKSPIPSLNKPFPAKLGTIGGLILAKRKEAGLTQEKLAEISSIHRQWLGRWERGRALPSDEAWSRLQTVLQLPAKPNGS